MRVVFSSDDVFQPAGGRSGRCAAVLVQNMMRHVNRAGFVEDFTVPELFYWPERGNSDQVQRWQTQGEAL